MLIFFIPSISSANSGAISRSEAFIFLADAVSTQVPESYQFISLSYPWIPKNSKLEDALQKLVYLNLIKNKNISLQSDKKISIYDFEKILQLVVWVEVSWNQDIGNKKNIFVSYSDLEAISKILGNKQTNSGNISIVETTGQKELSNLLWEKSKILTDIYNTLWKDFYGRDDLKKEDLINGAIKWFTDGAWDTYTTYFPAVESSTFFEWLDGEFEWIGAYVEMPQPGNLIIISPIVGSPAEKAWILAWDKVIAVDGKNITETTSLQEAVSWIKWISGTSTTLTIQRAGNKQNITITVKREKINIDDISYSKPDAQTAYIQIKTFGNQVSNEFNQTLTNITNDTNIQKIIIDVRNNPGWYLDEVAIMLSHFVPKWETTVIVSNGENDVKYKSLWLENFDASKYKLVVLQNGGSASASEILVGTLKDYFPETIIVGEKSFWKWSVQSLKTYYDGSTLKYTSAKWYTGKTRKAIDHVGIIPDIIMGYDTEKFKNQNIDTQFQEALRY